MVIFDDEFITMVVFLRYVKNGWEMDLHIPLPPIPCVVNRDLSDSFNTVTVQCHKVERYIYFTSDYCPPKKHEKYFGLDSSLFHSDCGSVNLIFLFFSDTGSVIMLMVLLLILFYVLMKYG